MRRVSVLQHCVLLLAAIREVLEAMSQTVKDHQMSYKKHESVGFLTCALSGEK